MGSAKKEAQSIFITTLPVLKPVYKSCWLYPVGSTGNSREEMRFVHHNDVPSLEEENDDEEEESATRSLFLIYAISSS